MNSDKTPEKTKTYEIIQKEFLEGFAPVNMFEIRYRNYG